MTARQRRQPRQGFLAWLSLLFPLGASLAAQITWAVRTGSVVLGVWGGLATVLLALSIHRWRRLPSGLVRDCAMAGVVLAVGGWTWLHSALLLISELPPEPNRFVHYVSVGLCIAAFLPIEGLAVLSVLALDQREPEPEIQVPDAKPEPAASTFKGAGTVWGGPETVVDPTPPRPTVVRPVPAAKATPAPAARATALVHADGWRESMTSVARTTVDGRQEPHRDWMRRRATACGLPQRAGRLDVERAEVTRASGVERDPDDERERVPA